MSTGWQFAQPEYLFYAKIWLVVLAVAGVTLLALRFTVGRTSRTVAAAIVTYRSWWAILPLVALPLGLGRSFTILAVTLLSLWCFQEFARGTGLYRDLVFSGVVCVAIAVLGFFTWIRWYGMFLVWPVYVMAVILVLPVLRNRTEGMIQKTCLSIVGFLYFGWFLGHLGYMANLEHGLSYLLFLTLTITINDVAAYGAGNLFGRHTLASQVSPRKTWEGAIGCVLVTAAVVWMLRSTLPHFRPLQLVLSALIVGVGGQLGDLVISVIKRDLGVKDLGAVFPGHGGWLDRFDSLIFVSPLFFHMVAYFYQVP